MIKIIALILALLVMGPAGVYAETMVETEMDKDEGPKSICPFTLISSETSCVGCHKVEKVEGEFKWGIKEDQWRDLPYGTKIVERSGRESLHYKLTAIDADKIFDIYEYCSKYGINSVEIEINSPGGSVVEAWRIVAMIQSYPKIHTTTKCYGYAASAGFIVLVSGDHRIASPRAMLMAHELWTLKFLSIETPAASKDEAEDMQLWQNNINEWLAEKSNLTVYDIAKHIHKRDWWMTGQKAEELGFIDELTWVNKKVEPEECDKPRVSVDQLLEAL